MFHVMLESVMYDVSCIYCRASFVVRRVVCHVSCVMCRVSCVVCHVSCVSVVSPVPRIVPNAAKIMGHVNTTHTHIIRRHVCGDPASPIASPERHTNLSTGPPDAVHHCSVTNQTDVSFVVRCTAGFDGGLQQQFTLELFGRERRLKLNTSHDQPLFSVAGLEPGQLPGARP